MKKVLFVFVVAFLVMAGCSSEDSAAPKEESKPEKVKQEEVEKEQSEKDEKKEETDNEDGILTKVGQTTVDDRIGATVELLAIKEINETIDLSPIELTIKDIKVLRMTGIKNKEFLNQLKHFTDKTEIEYIQIQYEIENTKDTNVRLNLPIEAVVLNTGEQIESVDKDLTGDPNFAKTLYGKAKNESRVGLLIDDSNPEDISEIKIVTGRIDDAETMRALVDEKTFTYQIK